MSLKTIVEVSPKVAAAVYDVAERFGVEPIEMYVYLMAWKFGYISGTQYRETT